VISLKTLFSFNGGISRQAYLTIALVGGTLKHVVNIAIATLFHRDWDWLSYLMPVGLPTQITRLSLSDIQFLVVMLAVSLPFAWVGLAITAKRFRTIGWPAWIIVLFFVPIANVASFAVAAAWPEHSAQTDTGTPSWVLRIVPADALGAALFTMVVTAVLGTLIAALGTQFMSTYGWGLFAALPFVQGTLSAYLNALRSERSLASSVGVASLSISVTALMLLAFALEGAVCIGMAFPIALGFAVIGACFGHAIGRRSRRVNVAVLLTCVFLAPTIMGAERISNRVAPTYAVVTSVDIDATPAAVWHNVVSFPDLPPPTELPFRAGIAYPIRAKIEGRGVGAIRYCEFSTGNFVEPVTVWEPGHKLAFNVAQNPEPMREWSPYGSIDEPHLHGYMVSRHGEFVLTPLPGGRTRLTGTTWYQHHLWPATYWAVWSNAIVHDIHLRVLKHIKKMSESPSYARL